MRLFTYFLVLVIFNSCNSDNSKDEGTQVDIDLLQVPHYKVDSVYLDRNYLVAELTDDKPLHNPTIYEQALSWYSYQLYSVNADFDSIQFKLHIPKKSRTITTAAPISDLKMRHEALDGTVLEDFYYDFMKLNWESRESYSEIHSSLLDRTNSLFARHIDTTDFKELFPNNSTWWGTNSFFVFQLYLDECSKNEIGVGHHVVSTVYNSTKYFKPEDKISIEDLLVKYCHQLNSN